MPNNNYLKWSIREDIVGCKKNPNHENPLFCLLEEQKTKNDKTHKTKMRERTTTPSEGKM